MNDPGYEREEGETFRSYEEVANNLVDFAQVGDYTDLVNELPTVIAPIAEVEAQSYIAQSLSRLAR